MEFTYLFLWFFRKSVGKRNEVGNGHNDVNDKVCSKVADNNYGDDDDKEDEDNDEVSEDDDIDDGRDDYDNSAKDYL